ncbi:hypothetical protein BDR07DRAFT_1376135 [Suillus spraguei]|nr:hypothetical protein BDR07DRAFT_1376135 [Suillus spraguei]
MNENLLPQILICHKLSSLSPSQTGSPRQRSGFCRNFWDKVIGLCCCTANNGRSPSPSRVDVIASEQHFVAVRMPQSVIQPKPLDPEVVNERIEDATSGITGIHPVSENAQNATSAVADVQTVLSEVDTWTAILGPLRAFNSVANRIGDVHTFIYVKYVADLREDSSLFEGSNDYFD